nr:hypothetical protein [uncultured archaeon]
MNQRTEAINKKSGVKRENSASYKRKSNSSPLTNSSADRIMFLQRTVGNQAVERLIKSGALQAKLRIGQPGDVYEQEADRVADAVMRMPEPGVQRQVEPEEEEEEVLQTKLLVDHITPLVQRQVEEEEEEEMLQAKSRKDATPEVSNDLESQINAIKGGGRPLAKSERAYFDPRFGADFSQVRVHSDAQAVESTQVLNARAYTLGQDVVFGAGQYAPGTSEGRRLMAHELTHVIQQSGEHDTGSAADIVQHINERTVALMIQRDWVPDRNGDLYYNTLAEAQTRMNSFIRVASFVSGENTYWRVEYRTESDQEWRPDRDGNLFYHTEVEARTRSNDLMQVTSFTSGDRAYWRVELNSENPSTAGGTQGPVQEQEQAQQELQPGQEEEQGETQQSEQPQSNWLPDRNGNLHYNTRAEAETRMNSLIHVASFVSGENTYWRIEWRTESNQDLTQDRDGTLYYNTEDEANARLNNLMRLNSFTSGNNTYWRVERDPELSQTTQPISKVIDDITYYRERADAESAVPEHVHPKNCFVWNDGPDANYPWRAMPGTGCAHWVAHEMDIYDEPSCFDDYAIRVSQVIEGRTQYSLEDAQIGDVWTNTGLSHCGIVRASKTNKSGVVISASVEHCSSRQGGVVTDIFKAGHFYR